MRGLGARLRAVLPRVEVQRPAPERRGRKLAIVVNDRVTMTRGKYAAQAVHAALLAARVHPGGPVVVLGGSAADVAAQQHTVRDAGRTELAPGTLTAGASWIDADARVLLGGEHHAVPAPRDPTIEQVRRELAAHLDPETDPCLGDRDPEEAVNAGSYPCDVAAALLPPMPCPHGCEGGHRTDYEYGDTHTNQDTPGGY